MLRGKIENESENRGKKNSQNVKSGKQANKNEEDDEAKKKQKRKILE